MKKLKNYKDGDILLYLLSIVPFFLCANARIHSQVLGLSLGLYVALIYCRCNYFLLSPMYVAGCALADASVVGLVYAISPVFFLGCAKLLHYMFAKPMNMLSANIFACVGLLPVFIFDLGVHNLPYAITSLALNQVFCYCAIIICYALVIRGVRNALSADELASGFILLCVMAIGLYRASFWGFMPYFLVLGWTLLVCTHSFSLNAGTAVCFAIGMGGAAASGNLAVCGAVVAMFCVSYPFKKLSIWFCLASVLLTDLLCGAFFNAYTYDILHICALAAGGLAFAVLPRKIRAKIPVYITDNNVSNAKQIVKHSRSEIFARLTGVAKVFYEMGDCFGYRKSALFTEMSPSQAIAKEIMLQTCTSCPGRPYCQSALGSDTSSLFEGVSSIALSGGRPSPEDMPTFVSARCKNIPQLIAACNTAVTDYKERQRNEKQYELSQQIVAEQMYGVGNLLTTLADDVNKGINFDATFEQKLIEELSYCNIVCTDAVSYCENGDLAVSLTMRKDDVSKRAADEIVSKVVGRAMRREEGVRFLSDKATVTYCCEPRYSVIYGEATAKKDNSNANGDSKSVQKMRKDKLFVAICDGMGSGENAHSTSLATLNMAENFYKAGFEGESVLNMINRLLILRSREGFSALDLCVIDLKKASAHFVKLGAVQSFIKRGDSVETVQTSALPIGIVEEAAPFTDNKLLSPGDVVVMVSDGITDALGADGISLILSRAETFDPQELCDTLLSMATRHGAKDDSTVVAVRLV